MRHDPPIPADEHAPLVNPRALTTLATAVGLIYALHQPVRFVLRVASDVELLSSRVGALETRLDKEPNEGPNEDTERGETRNRATWNGGTRQARKAPRHRSSSCSSLCP